MSLPMEYPNAVASSSRLPPSPMDSSLQPSGFLQEGSLGDGLPQIDIQHFVPFKDLVTRTANLQYARIVDLIDHQLPELPVGRPRINEFLSFAHQARGDFLRLMGIVRWKEQADLGYVSGGEGMTPSETGGRGAVGGVSQIYQLQELLIRQGSQYLPAQMQLSSAKSKVEALRAPNADIGTSVDVLTSGEYQRLPRYLYEEYERREPETREEVLTALEEINQLLTIRMLLYEDLPQGVVIDRITDGRVYLRAPDIYECTITIISADMESPWHLIDIRFLFSIPEHVEGRENFPQALDEGRREWVEQTLVKQVLEYAPRPEAGEEGRQVGEKKGKGSRRRNTALVKMGDVLQHASLLYQMQALHHQARRLATFTWRDKMRPHLSVDGQTLSLSYWLRKTKLQPTVPPARAPGPINEGPEFGGKIVISIAPIAEESPGDFTSFQFGGKCGLSVEWAPTPGWMAVGPVDVMEYQEGLKIESSNLDLVALLEYVTKCHATALIKAEHKQIVNWLEAKPEMRMIFESVNDFYTENVGGSPVLSMLVKVFAPHNLHFQVNYTTGQLDVREADNIVGSTLEKRIGVIKSVLGDAPQRLVEQVFTLKKQLVLDMLFEKLRYLALSPIPHALRGALMQDLEKFGLVTKIGSTLRQKAMHLVPLELSADHALLIVMQEPAFSYGMATMRTVTQENGQERRTLSQLSWLDVTRILGKDVAETKVVGGRLGLRVDNRSTGFDVSLSELYKLYAYCNAKLLLEKVEAQLVARSIPYQRVTPKDKDGRVPALPSLQVEAQKFFTGSAAGEVSMPNISISLRDWERPTTSQVVTSIKLRPAAASASSNSVASELNHGHSDELGFEAASSVLTLSPPMNDQYLDQVLAQWANLSKLLLIAGQVDRFRHEVFKVRLVSFDLQEVICEYMPGQYVSVQFDSKSDQYGATFFTSDGTAINPHSIVEGPLVEYLNSLLLTNPSNGWIVFLRHLTHTHSCLNELLRLRDGSNAGHPPNLIGNSPFLYLLTWDKGLMRNAIKVEFTSLGSYFVISDATSSPHERTSLQLRDVPKWRDRIQRAMEFMRENLQEQVAALAPGETRADVSIQVIGDNQKIKCDWRSVETLIRKLAEGMSGKFL